MIRVVFAGLICVAASAAAATPGGYAVVVSQATHADADWKRVVDTLVETHGGKTIVYDKLADVREPLAKQFPKYACFVATSAEAGREFVAEVHRLTRRLDDDPYTDCRWGVLTGYDAANALTIAKTTAPLIIHKAASGTEIALDRCEQGIWFCELQKNRRVEKKAGGKPEQTLGPDDTTQALADTLTNYQADLFVTSGHATERDWQIGYRYNNGYFTSKAGQLFGRDTKKQTFPIRSDNPKVYLPIGNCLMGHIDGPDAMALAFMNSAGVRQMIGYTVLTWYGYGGWGCLDTFIEQPGRYTFNEAFLANHLALLHKLETEFPAEARVNPVPGAMVRNGLLYDRDTVAFYGDPAWEARMAPGPLAYEQMLTEKDGVYTFTIRPLVGATSFEPVNKNGSQRGGRPMVGFLPRRVRNVKLLSGQELKPVITDDFILVPNPQKADREQYQVSFSAEEMP